MAEKIGPATGIIASREALKEMSPNHKVAWENQANTLTTLVHNSNEYMDRIEKLEKQLTEKPAMLPFPGSG